MLFAFWGEVGMGLLRTLTACLLAFGLSGCFGSGSSNSPAPILATVSGTVAGLNGTVTIALGQEHQDISSNGSFAFGQRMAEGQSYSVSVVTQPVGQKCVVANGSGTVGSATVNDISVECTTDTHAVGGTLSGLVGSVELQTTAGEIIELTSDGTFAFPTPVLVGQIYDVSVHRQPADAACVVSSGSGVVGEADITSILVKCEASTHLLGGGITGLIGTLVLSDGTDTITTSTDGPFTFATPVRENATFSVTVQSQPATQTCTVTSGSGTMGSAEVTDVVVVCSVNTYTVGGTIAGLVGGTSLQLDGGDTLIINSDGIFTFPTPLAHGSPYSVAVLAQPATQTCTVANGAGIVGAGNVTSVSVTCLTNTYTIGGILSGLVGTVALQNNSGDTLTINSDGTFTFPTPLADGSAYSVTVLTQPPTQTCTVANGAGIVGAGNVTNVSVICSINTYTIGGTLSGLVGTVTLQNNGGDDLVLNTDGAFTFLTPVVAGAPYSVTVATQPSGESCIVANDSGVVSGSNITNVQVTCVPFATVSAQSGVIPVNAGSLALTVTNTSSTSFAYNIHAALPSGWTAVTQDASSCTSVPAMGSCTLLFTSTEPYVAQGNIAITGDSVASGTTTALAFSIQGYLVFGVGPVAGQASVIDSADRPTVRWAPTSSDTGVIGLANGAANTAALVALFGAGSYAANSCATHTGGSVAAGTWYLPAFCQLNSTVAATCNAGTPAVDKLYKLGFGGFTSSFPWYSSSTQYSSANAWAAVYDNNLSNGGIAPKNIPLSVRCARTIGY